MHRQRSNGRPDELQAIEPFGRSGNGVEYDGRMRTKGTVPAAGAGFPPRTGEADHA